MATKGNEGGDDEGHMAHTCISVPGLSQGFLVCNQQMSITKVLREVKRCEHSIFNCVASILEDAKFVRRVHDACSFPVYGNKRCGAWYTGYSEINDTCYFKSTDGHVNQWSFSMTRLNLHVAFHAVNDGGCIIVDATRRGKKFPDALSKTVPIWAAVVNTCVLLYQMDHNLPLMEDSLDYLCLPDWIPDQEKSEIEKRIDPWATQLLESELEDISLLAERMSKPLQCCWVHPSDTSYVDILSINSPTLILVSASEHGSRERKKLQIDDKEFMYDYVPGGGDDEESWAMGLTPSIMWEHYIDILSCSHESIRHIISLLVENGHLNQKRGGKALYEEDNYITWFGETGLAVATSSYVLSNKDLDLHVFVNLSETDLSEHLGFNGTSVRKSSTTYGGGMAVKNVYVLEVTEERPLTRHVWIPKMMKKNQVIQCAPAAIEFASLHLDQGQKVVFVYDGIMSTSGVAVGLVLSTIIACFDLPEGDLGSPKWLKTSQYSVNESLRSIKSAHSQFTREVFKTYVARTVAQYSSHIIVSKSILKQVFNLFIRV